MIPSVKLHIRFLLLPANKLNTSHDSSSMAEEKAVPYTLKGILTPSCSCYTAPGFGQKPNSPKTTFFPSAATIQNSHGLLESPGQALFVFNTIPARIEESEHSTCVIFQTPHPSHKRSKLWDSWKRLEKLVWLEQKGQR